MRRLWICSMVGMLMAGLALAEGKDAPATPKAPETKGKPQTVCPVMGGKINKNVYLDHAGKRIYVCCAGCISALKADPAKYIKKLEDEGVVLDAAGTEAGKK